MVSRAPSRVCAEQATTGVEAASAHDLAQRRDAVEHRHVEVHGADVGLERAHLLDGVAAVLGLAYHFETAVALEQLL